MTSKVDITSLFPAPTFRTYQKETLIKMDEAFESGYRAILLEAPTGSGKSAINTTFCRSYKSFYATPQLALIDQILRDKFIGKFFTEIKGRQNYDCTKDVAATCDVGICQRTNKYECDKLEECPYWIQKLKALNSHTALMSFAYLILEGRSEGDYSFGKRDLLVLDEAHSIDSHIVATISLTIAPYTVPMDVYRDIRQLLNTQIKDMIEVISIVRTIYDVVTIEKDRVRQLTIEGNELTIEQAKFSKRLQDWIQSAEWLLNTYKDTEWVWQQGWTSYRGVNYPTLNVTPLYARFFTGDLLWNKADRFIISSATILDPNNYIKQTGLDLSIPIDKIKHIRVSSTFPVVNRPIIDTINGRLTAKVKDDNMAWAMKVLEAILDVETGKNIAVHCVSYQNAQQIADFLPEKYHEHLIVQTPDTRRESLALFEGSKGNIFLSVAYTEGVDWIGDLCEAQVLFKVPYMNIGDRRVARRLEHKEWRWYRLEAMKQVIQAYGRAVRSPTDVANFYVIDEAFIDLIKYSRKDMPGWFTEALPQKFRDIMSGRLKI